MFFDEATIQVKSGDGGGGMMHFHREKFVNRGGPDGGNGGKGGDIIVVASPHVNTLIAFNHQRKFVADGGEKGSRTDMTGASGEDTIIKVPLGTVVRDADSGVTLADLTVTDQQVIVAK